MKLIFAAALALAACAPAAAPPDNAVVDAAGNWLEPLAQDGDRNCSADGDWCVGADGVVTHGNQQWRLRDGGLAPGETVWPAIVRADGGDRAWIGVLRREEQMYSGGDASATHLTLYAIDEPNLAPRPVLTAPIAGQANIRACFDEADVAARREACQDQYEFSGELALDTSVDDGAPRFILTTEATTYPGRRSRSSDSTEAAPLTEADLRHVRDDTCSYRRVAARGEDGEYAYDEPLPACTDYLEP